MAGRDWKDIGRDGGWTCEQGALAAVKPTRGAESSSHTLHLAHIDTYLLVKLTIHCIVHYKP
jgi:hypothetical protein